MDVFVTGGTGYVGQALIPALLQRGHRVIALVRPESLSRVPAGAVAVAGDALDASTFADAIPRGATIASQMAARSEIDSLAPPRATAISASVFCRRSATSRLGEIRAR